MGREYRRKAPGSQLWLRIQQQNAVRIGMPSFDVVSELDSHEVTNAVDQANRELHQRFDFKDTGAVFELNGMTIAVKAEVEFQLKQMLEILKLRLAKRGVDVLCLEIKDPRGQSRGRGPGGDPAPRGRR